MVKQANKLEVGMKVTCMLGGNQFVIGKIEKDDIGRIILYDTEGKVRHHSGKSVKYLVSNF